MNRIPHAFLQRMPGALGFTRLRGTAAIALLCLSSLGESAAAQELTETVDFGVNPGNLRMFQFIPAPHTDEPKALVLVLHGCGQNAQDIAHLTGWNKLAELHDLIVIYPQQRSANNLQGCFNWFESKDTDRGKGEVESIHEMTRHAIRHWNIDTTRIHVVGYSAGAAMSVSLLAAYPGTFAGGASFAGTAYQLAQSPGEGAKVLLGKVGKSIEELRDRVLEQAPEFKGAYPRLVVFQGMKDRMVPPRHALLLVDQWKALYPEGLRCAKEPPTDALKAVYRTSCVDATGNERVILYGIEGLGHKVSIAPGPADDQGGHKGWFAVDRGFHSTYRAALDLGVIGPVAGGPRR